MVFAKLSERKEVREASSVNHTPRDVVKIKLYKMPSGRIEAFWSVRLSSGQILVTTPDDVFRSKVESREPIQAIPQGVLIEAWTRDESSPDQPTIDRSDLLRQAMQALRQLQEEYE